MNLSARLYTANIKNICQWSEDKHVDEIKFFTQKSAVLW